MGQQEYEEVEVVVEYGLHVGFHVGHTTEIWVVPWEEKVNTGK